MSTRPPGHMGILVTASRLALQWRLQLLWLLAQALPLALMWLPLWAALSAKLDHSLTGRGFTGAAVDGALYVTILQWLGTQQAPAATSGGLWVLALQLPWLAGVLMTAASTAERLPLGSLIAGGLSHYWRMTRLGLWGLTVLGLAATAGGALVHLAHEHGGKLILEAEADRIRNLALAVAALLFVLAEASVDAARARLVTEPQRRSVVLAQLRASAWLLRRPRALGLYLLLTAAGLLAVAGLAWLRLHWPASGALGWLRAVLLGQALVLGLGWMRASRLFALVACAQATQSALRQPTPHTLAVAEEAAPQLDPPLAQGEPDGL